VSKTQKIKPTKDSVVDSAPAPLEPSRTLGLLILLLSIIFTAVWLTRESIGKLSLENSTSISPDTLGTLAGFDSNNWYLANDSAFGFVEIPAGAFTMGSNPVLDSMAYGNEQWSRRKRQGEVELPRYFISRFETTVAQYSAYLVDTDQLSQALNLNSAGNFPVAGVTWAETLRYARWLEEKLRQSTTTPEQI
jgi:formylglycine-generating enzyme required for sulfatase activity